MSKYKKWIIFMIIKLTWIILIISKCFYFKLKNCTIVLSQGFALFRKFNKSIK